MMVEFPSASLSNGLIDVQLYLPDSEIGFYRGTRFEWSGVIRSLRYRGHECFGQWKEHSPQYHDCITGPAGEFQAEDTPDHDFLRVNEGDPFLRLGVGLLMKTGGGEFVRFSTYPIVDASGWTFTESPRRMSFQHSGSSPTGMSYRFHKVVSVEENAPRLSLLHRIENTGKIPIGTRHYYHNFFCMDGIHPGPSLELALPVAPAVQLAAQSPLAVSGTTVSLLRRLDANERIFVKLLDTRATYALEIRQRATEFGVSISSDQQLSSLLLWINDRVFCPEPYIDIRVEPGEDFTWSVWYDCCEGTSHGGAA